MPLEQLGLLLELLLELLLLLLYAFYHVFIRGREAPPCNYVINAYIRSLQQQTHQLQAHFGNFFQNAQTLLAWTHLAFSESLFVYLYLEEIKLTGNSRDQQEKDLLISEL